MTTVTSAKCPLQAHKLRRKPLLHAVHHMNTTVENSQWQFLKVFFGNRIDGGCHSSTMGITVDFKFKVVYHLSHTPLCVRAKAWAEAAHSHQSDGGNERYLIRAKAQGSAVSSEWRRKSRECLLIGMRAGKSTLCFRVKEYRQDNPWKTIASPTAQMGRVANTGGRGHPRIAKKVLRIKISYEVFIKVSNFFLRLFCSSANSDIGHSSHWEVMVRCVPACHVMVNLSFNIRQQSTGSNTEKFWY